MLHVRRQQRGDCSETCSAVCSPLKPAGLCVTSMVPGGGDQIPGQVGNSTSGPGVPRRSCLAISARLEQGALTKVAAHAHSCLALCTHAWHCALMLGIALSAHAVQVLDMRDFYNDAINEPDFNIKEDYKRWKAVRRLSPAAQPASDSAAGSRWPWVDSWRGK